VKGRVAAEQQAAVLTAKLESMTERTTKAEARVDALEKQLHQVSQELNQARVQAQAQQGRARCRWPRAGGGQGGRSCGAPRRRSQRPMLLQNCAARCTLEPRARRQAVIAHLRESVDTYLRCAVLNYVFA
jgi:hypothetical protein